MDNSILQYATHDRANARIRELETQLGMPPSPEFDFIENAWDRIALLGQAVAKLPGKNPTATVPVTTASPTPVGKRLFGLARAIAANQRPSPTLAFTPTAGNKPLVGLARAIAANQRKTRP